MKGALFPSPHPCEKSECSRVDLVINLKHRGHWTRGMREDSAESLQESERILVHCDLDAFFAAVEILHRDLDPERPLIIGSDPPKGAEDGVLFRLVITQRGLTEFALRCRSERLGGDVQAPPLVPVITLEGRVDCTVVLHARLWPS